MKTLNDWRKAQGEAASMTAKLGSQDAGIVQTTPTLPARMNLFNRIARPWLNGLGAAVVQTTPTLPARANLFNRIAHPSINGLGAAVVQTTPTIPPRTALFNVIARPSINGLGAGSDTKDMIYQLSAKLKLINKHKAYIDASVDEARLRFNKIKSDILSGLNPATSNAIFLQLAINEITSLEANKAALEGWKSSVQSALSRYQSAGKSGLSGLGATLVSSNVPVLPRGKSLFSVITHPAL